ncbi:MAG TPA: hypothetical protein VGF75_00755 [Candidatus Saccharimonadales bacterium]
MRQLMRSEVSPWMIFIAIAIAFMLMCLPAGAQSTTVTTTAVDQSSQVWSNGTWTLQFVPNPNNPTNNVHWNGAPFPTSEWLTQGSLDGSGAFSQSGVQSNNFITPAGSTYTLTICPNATAPCSVIRSLTITGSSIDFSSNFTANTLGLKITSTFLYRAYNDSEVAPNPSFAGYFYLNVGGSCASIGCPRYWGQDQAWHNFLSGVASLSAGDLPPLFTTSLGSDPTNPDLTFTLDTAAANKVFGNCTTSTATPNFCSLTAAMIPALPYLPVGTSIYYQNIHFPPGTSLPQEPIFTFTSFFNVIDSGMDSTEIDAAQVGANKTCTSPSSQVIDVYGRVTACTNGTAPSTQVIRTAVITPGCTTPSGPPTGASCSDTLTWSGGGFADTNYQVTCMGGTPFNSGSSTEANAIDLTGWGSKTATTINTLTVSKGSDGNASFGSIECIGVHN